MSWIEEKTEVGKMSEIGEQELNDLQRVELKKEERKGEED